MVKGLQREKRLHTKSQSFLGGAVGASAQEFLTKDLKYLLGQIAENAGVERARVTSRGFGAFLPIEGAVEAADINRRGVIHFRGGCPNDLVRKVEP